MFEPTFPDNIRHIIELENSSSIISLVVYPDTHLGIHGLWMLIFICMHITAPMKNEMSSTMSIESTPSCDISLIYLFMNILIRSGILKVLPISMK